MLKLKRYLKPYLALLLAAVALLFGQAMLELTLPNYMSDDFPACFAFRP